jgi:hypothetical protein
LKTKQKRPTFAMRAVRRLGSSRHCRPKRSTTSTVSWPKLAMSVVAVGAFG